VGWEELRERASQEDRVQAARVGRACDRRGAAWVAAREMLREANRRKTWSEEEQEMTPGVKRMRKENYFRRK
jgi:hypothetical protein